LRRASGRGRRVQTSGEYLQILFRPVGDPYNLLVRRTGDVREFRLATAIAHEPGRFVRHILLAFVAVSADQLGNTFATAESDQVGRRSGCVNADRSVMPT